MNKKRMSIMLNGLIVVMEFIAMVMTYNYYNRLAVEYYTQDSNLLALIVSSVYLVYLAMNKDIPKWLKLLKYISIINLTVTFIVVMLVLAPMLNFDYKALLFEGSLVFQHLLCPLVAVISFIFFDEVGVITKKDNLNGLSLTIVYAVILITLNILDIVKGPYPFLMVKEQSILASIFWLITIISMAYLIAFALRKIYNYERKQNESN